jgi:hypothetical protein
MTQEERDNLVAEFISSFIQKLPHFLDNKIMTSFDVKFQYNGKNYQFALIEEGIVNGKQFELYLNSDTSKN